MVKTSPSIIDGYIGHKIKLKRAKSGKSLQDFGDILGVSFQQIQKYEKGQNKISSSNLYLLARYLKTDISYFFEGIEENEVSNFSFEMQEERDDFDWSSENIPDKELICLIKYYSKVSSTETRKKILDLIKVL